jgi:hypothetical protein
MRSVESFAQALLAPLHLIARVTQGDFQARFDPAQLLAHRAAVHLQAPDSQFPLAFSELKCRPMSLR